MNEENDEKYDAPPLYLPSSVCLSLLPSLLLSIHPPKLIAIFSFYDHGDEIVVLSLIFSHDDGDEFFSIILEQCTAPIRGVIFAIANISICDILFFTPSSSGKTIVPSSSSSYLVFFLAQRFNIDV